MKQGILIILLIVGIICLFFNHQILKVYNEYLKIIGIVLVMFSVYKLSSKVSSRSKNEQDSGNFKF